MWAPERIMALGPANWPQSRKLPGGRLRGTGMGRSWWRILKGIFYSTEWPWAIQLIVSENNANFRAPGNASEALLWTAQCIFKVFIGRLLEFQVNFWFCSILWGTLVLQSGVKPVLPAAGVQSPNRWTAREAPSMWVSDWGREWFPRGRVTPRLLTRAPASGMVPFFTERGRFIFEYVGF